MKNTDEVRDLLLRVPIFESLGHRARGRLAQMAVLREYPAHTELMREGSVGLGLYVVVAGSVEVFRGAGQQRQVLGTLGAGDILGEMALVDEQPRAASATTLGPTECLLIPRESFQEAMEHEPEIAAALLPIVVGRLRSLQQRMMESHFSKSPLEAADSRASADTPDAATAAAEAEGGSRWLGLLRFQVAAGLTALDGLGSLTGVASSFLRTFSRESGLDEADDLETWRRRAPSAAGLGLRDVFERVERLPERWVASWRRNRTD